MPNGIETASSNFHQGSAVKGRPQRMIPEAGSSTRRSETSPGTGDERAPIAGYSRHSWTAEPAPETLQYDHLTGAGCIFHLILLTRLHLTTRGPQQCPLLRPFTSFRQQLPDNALVNETVFRVARSAPEMVWV